MSVETRTTSRTADIVGAIYLERWIQIDAGTDQIYGTSAMTGDLNVLALRAEALTGKTENGAITTWYKNPDPGEYDNGESNPAWYGQAIRVPFTRTQPKDMWHKLKSDIQSFVEGAFPGELILEANRRMERPQPGDLSDPAKYVLWTIEYD